MRRLIPLLILLSGCVHSLERDAKQPEPEEPIYDSPPAPKYRVIQLTCDSGKDNLADDCGLVHRSMTTDAFVSRFVQSKCDGEASDECVAKLNDAMVSAIVKRYPLADWDRVLACESCSIKTREEIAYETHNRAVIQEGERKARNARREAAETKAREDAERRRRIADAFSRLGEAFSNGSGGTRTTTTTCHRLGDTITCQHY